MEHEHMTFVWTEIAFLSMWYNEVRKYRIQVRFFLDSLSFKFSINPDENYIPKLYFQARSHRRDNLKTLIQEGRFEVLTGGWVMTDEANVHMYAMVDQMIEGMYKDEDPL